MNQVVTPAALRQKHSRIVVRGLRKHFTDISRQEQIVALDGIDLEIGDDEFLTDPRPERLRKDDAAQHHCRIRPCDQRRRAP